MSMQGESLERRKAIFKEILDENGVHISSDLAKKFDFREESLKKDIELINGLLEQNGYDFYIKYSFKNKGYLFKSRKDNSILPREAVIQRDPSSLFDNAGGKASSDLFVQKLLIQMLLNRFGECTLPEIEELCKRYRWEADPSQVLYGFHTYKGLIDDGIVIERKNEAGEPVYLLQEDAPYIVTIPGEQAEHIMSTLNWFHNLFFFSDDLKAVERKLEILAGDNLEDDFPEIKLVGLSNTAAGRMKEQKKRIESVHYKTKALHIVYEDRKGNTTVCDFKTGLIVFNDETGQYHLAGKVIGEDRDTVINAERIREISEIEEIDNDLFEDDHFLKIGEESLIISTEDPIPLKLKFKDEANVREKIENYAKERPHAKITFLENTEGQEKEFLYEDWVRGFNDTARFIRKFGKSVEVLEPVQLREQMIFSLNRTLERYQEAEDE